jgi:hypothetical protein
MKTSKQGRVVAPRWMTRHSAAGGPGARRRRWLAGVLLLCTTVNSAWAQGTPAVVTGAPRVFVRRGPGTEFPPFATLTEGSKVEVQEMEGEWSRVVISSGQVGYIHTNFLGLPSEAGGRPTADVTPRPTATPRPLQSSTAPQTPLAERNKALEAEVSSLQQELATLRHRLAEVPPSAVPSTPGAAVESDDVRAELRRLAAAVEALQHHLATGTPAVPTTADTGGQNAEDSPPAVSPTAIVLGAVGLILGWLFGAAYGRNQERGRRSRIRF